MMSKQSDNSILLMEINRLSLLHMTGNGQTSPASVNSRKLGAGVGGGNI